LLAHNVAAPRGDFLDFFVSVSWTIAGGCLLLLVGCWRYFAAHPATQGVGGPALA
jgi:hypothetical protein